MEDNWYQPPEMWYPEDPIVVPEEPYENYDYSGDYNRAKDEVKDWGHKHGYNWDDQIEEGEGEIKEWGREHEDQMPPVEEEGKHGHHQQIACLGKVKQGTAQLMSAPTSAKP